LRCGSLGFALSGSRFDESSRAITSINPANCISLDSFCNRSRAGELTSDGLVNVECVSDHPGLFCPNVPLSPSVNVAAAKAKNVMPASS